MHISKTRGFQASLFTAALAYLPAAMAIASTTSSSAEGATTPRASIATQPTVDDNNSLYFDGLLVLLRTSPAITQEAQTRASSQQCLRSLSYELDRQLLKGTTARSPFAEGRPAWPLQTILDASAQSAVLVFDTPSIDNSSIRATLYTGALKHAVWSEITPQPQTSSSQAGPAYCQTLLHETLAALESHAVSFGIDPLLASD